ncbi:VAMP-like protein ykt61 [Cymbomonas tetramitiformis]|uniref:VAMP-like protein ykt61 n=1 Tax=Cymbomonas tetramitiformis TaxID=36881 RepID=A0AAE0LEE3_9CHLO|nr:VAMP-like protein ykt61 [Cymbomonas tetramitiformis]
MKITCIAILRHIDPDTDPYLLGIASDLSSFGYFHRGGVKEMLNFVSRTIIRRTCAGQRQSVEHEEYMVHSCNKNGLSAIAFVDREYPSRSTFCVLNKVIEDYEQKFGEVWKKISEDTEAANPICESALKEFQDPAAADKLLKIQRELDETKVILHKTIDSVLARGEKLDSLVERSNDLSLASQVFYKQARKQNQCCIIV